MVAKMKETQRVGVCGWRVSSLTWTWKVGLCILLQEDNPFKLPSDDKIFAMREEERQRRAEERERVKHLHVWEKVYLSCSWFKYVKVQELEPLNTCT